ncbi:MAG: carboxylating nicotinate-nucleotide diphosphorylase [Bacteroidota bacterium]
MANGDEPYGRAEREVPFDGRILGAIENALREDIGMGDITGDSTLDADARTGGEFLAKADGVIAGIEVAGAVFHLTDEEVVYRPVVSDGTGVKSGTVIALVEGNARGILRAERVALNFLQRMGGIATMTRTYVDAVRGTKAKITDTRKTAPGLRAIDKLAVRIGGGVNHRYGLDDMVLIKDNHIVAAGGITAAVHRCQDYLREHNIKVGIEVETTSLKEVRESLSLKGLQRIMLDNFSVAAMREAVLLIGGRVEVEASGGITLESVKEVAMTGVDFISVGAITHSVHALDISLEFTSGTHAPHA